MGVGRRKKLETSNILEKLVFLRQLMQMEYLGLKQASLGVTLEHLLIDVAKSRISL